MAMSLSNILIHLVFSTKVRQPFINTKIKGEMESYLAAILQSHASPVIKITTMADHIHILFSLSKNVALSKLLQDLKASSSKWIKTKGPEFNKFQWQTGYGAFSVSESNKKAVLTYLGNQVEQHKKVTFQEEFRQFLIKHNIPFNEEYVWD